MSVDNYEVDGYESPRHKKVKQSDISKSAKKSDHRHRYKQVLIRSYNTHPTKGKLEHLALGKKCEICGKVNIVSYFLTEPSGHGTCRVLNNEAIRSRYPHLEIVEEQCD